MKKPELTTSSEKIDRIIQRISSGDIKIPAFQRGFVWKQGQIVALLESILNNYPISSILLWQTMNQLQFTRNIAGYPIPNTKEEYPVNYVLDGQQRLSSLYGVFSGVTQIEKGYEMYDPNKEIFELFYDLETNNIINKDEALGRTRVFQLNKIFNSKSLVKTIATLDQQDSDDLIDVQSNFNNYEIPVVTIKNRNINEVGVIFERINNTGTRLSTLDLMIAWTWTDNFNFSTEINDFFEELDQKGFGSISRNLLLQIISGLVQNDTKTSSILNLDGERVRAKWNECKKSIRKAVDFLSTELNCRSIDFLPYQQQLSGFSKFFQLIKKPKSEQIEYLKIWFWKHSFSTKYFTGQTTEKMNNDISLMYQIKDEDYSYFDSVSITVSETEILKTKFSKASYLTRSFLLLSAQYSPLDLCNGNLIDIGKSLSIYNRKEYHHVFPKAHLKEQGFDIETINNITNFCFLPSDSNKIISNSSPSKYIFGVLPQNKMNSILSTNLLPTNYNLYRENNYRDFMVERASIILNKVKDIVRNR